MKYKSTATFFAVMAALSALSIAALLFFDYRNKFGTDEFSIIEFMFPVTLVLLALVCFSKRKAKLIPVFLLPPAVVDLMMQIKTVKDEGFAAALHDEMGTSIILISVLLFVLIQIAFRSPNKTTRKLASSLGFLPFVIGILLSVLRTAISDTAFKFGDLVLTAYVLSYLLFIGLWLTYQNKATIAAAERPAPVIPVWRQPAPPQPQPNVYSAPQPTPVNIYVTQQTAPVTPVVQAYPGQVSYVPQEAYVPQNTPRFAQEAAYVPLEPSYVPQEPVNTPPEEKTHTQPETVSAPQEKPARKPETVSAPPEEPAVTRRSAPMSQPDPTDPPMVVTNEMLGQLKMLNNLMTDGVITQEEFEARRKAIFRQQ